MNSSILLTIFTLSALFAMSTGCGIGIFPSMGGGGGGCGCGGGGGGMPPPPPPPSCGCMGGRKKRSAVPEKPAFYGIAAADDDEMCNAPELKAIIRENMHSSAADSSKAINGALESRQLQRFVVVCSENPFTFTVRADTVYCGAAKNGHNCHAYAI
uniref:Ground-like domain-containing protein n=1 Tax=Caenorhabditis japonica TaxID=281687 RepID=A0A8R1HJN5_CAEJA